jgi:hypothetical protein
MIGVEESVWVRAIAVVVTMVLIVPLFVFNHIPPSDDASPFFSDPNEPTGDEDFPYVFVEKVVQPSTIYPTTAPPGANPKSATVTLKITGSGQPKNSTKPQDTVFLIDNSGSMCDVPPGSDCNETRIDAMKQYIDIMDPEDQAAIVAFGKDCFSENFIVTWGAWIVDDWGCIADGKALHLTHMDKKGKEKLKDVAETLRWSNGSTNIEKAISVANWELIPGYVKRQTCLDYHRGTFPSDPPGGDANHTWVEILLTDGEPSHMFNCITEEIQDAVNAGIRIYTIGLGPSANGNWLENHISIPTGGKYYFAEQPEDLPAIYMEIATEVEERAFRPLPGAEPEVVDAIPKLLNPVDYSPTPTEIVDSGTHWLVKWDVNQILRIGDTWQASYEVSSDTEGVFDTTFSNAAKVQYTSWDGNRTETLIPSALLEVTNAAPPSPPTNLDAVLAGANHQHVKITWELSVDDGGNQNNVAEYRIYRGEVFDAQGAGYLLQGSVTKGTGEYWDLNAGDGDLSNHFYYVCAATLTDYKGCNVRQLGKFTRQLSEGMNLISIPLIQSDWSLTTVLQTVDYDEVWTYDNPSSQWLSHMAYKPYPGDFKQVDHTMGLWVKTTKNCGLTVAGIIPFDTIIKLRTGWNIIGFPSFSLGYTVKDLKVETGATDVEGFNPSDGPYFLRTMADGETMVAGYGYWVKVEDQAIWAVTNS